MRFINSEKELKKKMKTKITLTRSLIAVGCQDFYSGIGIRVFVAIVIDKVISCRDIETNGEVDREERK